MKKFRIGRILLAISFIVLIVVLVMIFSKEEIIDPIEQKLGVEALNYANDNLLYEPLANMIDMEDFKDEKWQSYLEYYDITKELSQVIKEVNIGLDYDFYDNIKEVTNPDDYLVLVNKHNQLSSDYEPADLVDIPLTYAYEGKQVRDEVKGAFIDMCRDALAVNIQLLAVSGYRTYEYQEKLYDRYVKANSVLFADKVAARPGHSEHQTGLAIDINVASTDAEFENTIEGAWLAANAHLYGFIIRYPQEYEYITGYSYEPWHIRYVGIEVGTELFEKSITLEEYLLN